MSTLISIPAARNSDTTTTISVVDTAGDPVDFTALGATRIDIKVCSQLHNSTIQAESFSGNIMTVAFGKLVLPPGSYSPKICYFTVSSPNGEIIAGPGFNTAIQLNMVC
jgi:hypothetical protein